MSPPPKPSALFLDLDGTLVDSRGDIANACNAARIAHHLEPLSEEVIGRMIGDGARALVSRAFSLYEGDPRLDEALASFHASYVEHPCVETKLFEGARELLERLRVTDVPCAVVTNKPREVTQLVLARLGIDALVRDVWAGGDGPLKPNPTGILTIAERLRVDPRRVWMVGDGPQDVDAGKSAGCFTIGIPGIAERERLVASGPAVICSSLVEVRALLAAAQS